MPVSRVKLRKPSVRHKNLAKEGAVGLAYSEEGEHRAEVDPNQTDREYFLTYAHELFHLLLPDLTEAQIVKAEKLYAASLWRAVLRLRRKWLKNTIDKGR